MIVRFGFVAMTLLLDNVTPSRTMTYATLSKLADREAGLRRLEAIAADNLNSTLRILKHAHAHQIAMYRLSSKLIPLATHQELADWDPYAALMSEFAQIGEFVRERGIRISFHPDHFCVFSTPRPEVLINSKRDLVHHVRMLECMGMDEASKCNIHMGGAYGDKASASERFIQQFGALESSVKHRVTLENDDKTFNVVETLSAAKEVAVPMVLDIHHHAVNPGELGQDELMYGVWPTIAHTWKLERDRLGLVHEKQLPPKIHVSSPKSASDPRGHADYVQVEPLVEFLRGAARTSNYIDCMLEAKCKDAALLQLMSDMKELERQGEGVRVVDEGSIEVEPA